MTININKEVGSKSNITIKGLGDPGPFSFAIIKGSLPTGTTFDQATGEIKGNFTQKGDFDVTIAGVKKKRIEGTEDFTFKITDWNLHKTDFKTLTDNNSLSWETTGTVTKITNDPDLFDGECYELNYGRLNLNLPEAIGTRDFEIDLIFKPLNNGGGDSWGRILMIGPNNTNGLFYFCRNSVDVPPRILFQYMPSTGSSYVYTFTTSNISNPLVNNEWNHILLVRKNGVLTYFLNGVREQEASLAHDLSRRELYIGANNSNTERFSCRVKRLQIRVYDNSHFNKQNLVTNVWKYKLKERTRYQLKSTERNNYLIECNFTGNYTTRVKEGYSLPTGLTLKDNKITGDSTLTNNLSIRIELLVAGVVNDEVAVNILDVSKPYRVFELPLVGTENDTVFGDTQSRQWTRRGDVKVVKDTDNFRDLTATYFDGAADSLYFTSDEFILGYDDFCYSFWLKPIDAGGTVSGRRIFNHGSTNVNGTFILADDYTYFYSSPPNITFYLYNNGWQKISTKADKLNDGFYNHIVIARKNNVWRVLINGKLVLETTYQINLTGNTLYIASNESNTENYKGNYFDFKLSRYVLDYWEPFIPPVITKWSSAPITINEQVNTDINKKFVSTWPHGGVTYKVSNSSALPLGLTLESSGLITGASTNVQAGTTIIECYINNVLNHTTTLTFDIVADVRSKYLTHSLKAYASNANGLEILKSSSSITTTLVSPVMTEVGPMLSLEFKNPYTAYGSLISIPHAETQLSKKAFCMELEIYFGGGLSIVGRGRAGYGGPQPLICKSYNGPAGEQGIYITEANGDFLLSLNSSSSIPNALNESSFITFDKSKRNHIAITYDLEKLRFFVNGKLEKVIDWVEGWASYATQNLELGQQMIGGYPGYFSAYTGFLDNFKLYQGSAIYTRDFTPELNSANLYPEFPVIEPNKPYKGSIVGINGHTVSLLTGSLPPGLTLSTDGKLTGTCTAVKGDYPVTFSVLKDSTIETISVNLSVAKYLIDLNLNNAINNSTLTDNCGNVFNVIGTPTIQDDSSFESGKSIYFNGTNSYLSIPEDKIFSLAKADFVIEFDFKMVTEPLPDAGSFPGIISQRSTELSNHSFSVWLATGYSTTSTNKVPHNVSNKTSVGFTSTNIGSTVGSSVECAGTGLEKNKVYKVKFVRANNTLRLYVNNRLTESVAISSNFTLFKSNQPLMIGCLDSASMSNRLFNGYLGSMKLYVPNNAELAAYVDTSVDPYYDNVVILLSMDGSEGSTTFIDNSPEPKTQTVGSGVALSKNQYRFTDTTLSLNGSNSYITVTGDNASFDLGTVTAATNFTVEFQIYPNAAFPSEVFLVMHAMAGSGGNGKGGWWLRVIDGNLQIWVSSISNQTNPWIFGQTCSASVLTVGAWSHVAWVIRNGLSFLYVNGVSQTLTTTTGTIWATTPIGLNTNRTDYGLSIGASFTDNTNTTVKGFLNGYLDDVRVTKGVARYTDNFTPPTDPFLKTIGETNDPYFDQVSLLLDMEGADGSTNIVDKSSYRQTVATFGQAKISTAQRKFYATSAYFNGGYIWFGNKSDPLFAPEEKDFCIEAMLYDTGSGNRRGLIGNPASNGGNSTFSIMINANNRFSVFVKTASGSQTVTSTNIAPLNTWYHLALVRNGNTVKLFINGSLTVTVSNVTGAITVGDGRFSLGSLGDYIETYGGSYGTKWMGYVDEFRYTIGVSRYTEDFSPPIAPFPKKGVTKTDIYYDNVSLLLSMDGTEGSTTFVDSSPTPKAITAYGNARISKTNSKFGGASGYFDGNGDYITLPNGQGFDFGSGDYTIEAWVYLTGTPSSGSYYSIISNVVDSPAMGWRLVIADTRKLLGISAYWSVPYVLNSEPRIIIPLNTWTHVAATRSGTSIYGFINGVLDSFATAEASSYIKTSTRSDISIGKNLNEWYFNGFIDELRVTKGVARYTSGFTPPSGSFPRKAPVVGDPLFDNVTLLLSFDGANGTTTITDNSKLRNQVTVVGSAAISTTQSKFGGSSLAFYGGAGYIEVPNIDFTSGDWTVEFMLYMDGGAGSGYAAPVFMIGTAEEGADGVGLSIFSSDGNYTLFLRNSYSNIVGGAFTRSKFIHIAITKESGKNYIFIEGVKSSPLSTSVNFGVGKTVRIGTSSGQWLQSIAGYIDELRITKGIARYTSGFTPPSKPFPKTGVEIIDAEVKDPYFNNVTLLLDMEGANDSTAFIDNSPAPKAITASGGAKISTAQSQWGGASAYFPGASGNRITIPAGDHFNFGAGDFTIEAWVRPSSVSDNKAVIGQYGFSGNRSWDFLLLGNVAHFRFTSGGVTDAMSLNSPVLQAGVSSHIAVVRSGSNFYVFANGVLGETKTSTAPIYSSSYTAAIGYNQEGAWPFFGYIDELRITKGVGRYTGNFTPPTGPFPKS